MYYVLYAKLLYITLLPGLTLAPCNRREWVSVDGMKEVVIKLHCVYNS